MAKRYIDTKIWGKDWYRSLTPDSKCLWMYLITQCDHAGIIDFSVPSINFHINNNPQKDYNKIYEDLKMFGDRLVIYEDGTKIWVKTFIDFQYGGLDKLSPSVRPQKAVIDRLHQQGLIDRDSFEYTEKAEASHIKPEEVLSSYQFELEKDFPDKDVNLEIQKMVDWLKANGKRKKNYRAFARNWLRSSFQENKPKTKYKLSDFKKTVDGRSYIGYCVKCSKSQFYDKYEIHNDSRCCKSELIPKRLENANSSESRAIRPN